MLTIMEIKGCARRDVALTFFLHPDAPKATGGGLHLRLRSACPELGRSWRSVVRGVCQRVRSQGIQCETACKRNNYNYFAVAVTTVKDFNIRTHRAGRLSCGATILNGPCFSPSGEPFIVSATITPESWKSESSSAKA